MCGQIDPTDLDALTHRGAVSLETEFLPGAVCGGDLCLASFPTSCLASGGWVGASMELRSLPGCHPHHRVELMQGRSRKDHPCASLSPFQCLSTNVLVVRGQKGAAEQGGGSEGVGAVTNT